MSKGTDLLVISGLTVVEPGHHPAFLRRPLITASMRGQDMSCGETFDNVEGGGDDDLVQSPSQEGAGKGIQV